MLKLSRCLLRAIAYFIVVNYWTVVCLFNTAVQSTTIICLSRHIFIWYVIKSITRHFNFYFISLSPSAFKYHEARHNDRSPLLGAERTLDHVRHHRSRRNLDPGLKGKITNETDCKNASVYCTEVQVSVVNNIAFY